MGKSGETTTDWEIKIIDNSFQWDDIVTCVIPELPNYVDFFCERISFSGFILRQVLCLGLQKQKAYKEAIQQIVFWNIENGVILKFKVLFLCLILILPLLGYNAGQAEM